MSLLLILFIAAVLFLVTTSLVLLVIGPVMLLNPHRRGKEYYAACSQPLSPADLKLQFSDFWFQSTGTAQLHAWYIPANETARGTILYLHGVGDNKIGGLPLAKVFHRHGFNVMLYDSRAHGMSEGKYCTYGYYERHDVKKAIDVLLERHDTHSQTIGVFGTSMGAAIAVQAAAIEARIAAVVAEGCFTNLRTITVDYQKRLIRLPWHFLRNLVMKRSEFLADFDHHEVSPLQSVKNIHVPILFIHGKNDTFIRYQYSEELYAAANQPKELYLIENASHTDIHQVARQEYEERVVRFFETYLAGHH
ncbi:MAG: alpha/beta hydrolase [Bacteroidota bacterium]|nr:alpha/beta hydrolase [Bacteroidota bacterium]